MLNAGKKERAASPTTSGSAAAESARVGRARPWLRELIVIVGVFCVPIELWIEAEHGRRCVLANALPLVDVLVWVAGGVALIRALAGLGKKWGHRNKQNIGPRRIELRRVPAEIWAFVVICGMSAGATTLGSASMDLLQFVDYYIIWYWIVARTAQFRGSPAIVATGVTALICLSLVVSAWQAHLRLPCFLITAVFRDHQSYLAAFVMLAPLAWCGLASRSNGLLRWFGHLLVGLGCCSIGSLAGALLVLGELALASVFLGGRWAKRWAAVAASTVVALLVATPAQFRDEMLRQPDTWLSAPLLDRRDEVLLAKIASRPSPPSLHWGVAGWHCFVGLNMGAWWALQLEPDEPPGPTEQRVPVEYFAESWSALKLISQGSMFGRGVGSWQPQVATAYGVLERTGTSPPNTANGYLLIAVTTGWVGLLAWCYAAIRAIRRGPGRVRRAASAADEHIACGCIAGMYGAAAMLLVCPFVVQSIAAYWVLLAALARGMRRSRKHRSAFPGNARWSGGGSWPSSQSPKSRLRHKSARGRSVGRPAPH